MYLLIDWGNTQLKYLLVDGLSELSSLANLSTSRIQQPNIVSSLEQLIGQLEKNILNKKISRALVASVNNKDDTNQLINQLIQFDMEVFIAKTNKVDCGVVCAYLDPERLGIDRWLAIIAGQNTRHTVGILDIGSAITFDVVNSKGVHLGGHILPGKKLLINSLTATANVRVEENINNTLSFKLGCTTNECVNFGANEMIGGYLKHIVSQATDQYNVKEWLLVGGGGEEWSKWLSESQGKTSTSLFLSCPLLVFSGLAKQYIQNCANV